MRSDLFAMVGVISSASLDDIISEAQKIEILYRRNEGQRLEKCFKQISFRNKTSDTHKHYNDDHTNHYKSTLSSYLEHSSVGENVFHQQNKHDTRKQWNNGYSLQDTNINLLFTTGNNSLEKQILFNAALA